MDENKLETNVTPDVPPMEAEQPSSSGIKAMWENLKNKLMPAAPKEALPIETQAMHDDLAQSHLASDEALHQGNAQVRTLEQQMPGTMAANMGHTEAPDKESV